MLKSNIFFFMKRTHFLCLLITISVSNCIKMPNSSDQLALIDFKNRITVDPLQVTNSWNISAHVCTWLGITCDPSNNRVTILNLESKQLIGSLPPSIGNITYLTGLNLRNNTFRGEIPNEIGRLINLRYLNLTYNSFIGKIPNNISHCLQLSVLDVVQNKLIGEIPDQLHLLSNMYYLGLGENSITGNIPPWIGNFSSLFALSLALNHLQGDIPAEFGNLSKLGFFQLYGNELTGTIPSSIYNISSIYYFSFTQNLLHGKIPDDIGLTLPNLKVFAGAVNNFTGRIPSSLANASRLQVIDFSENRMTGTVPSNLGKLQSLYRINFGRNKLGDGKPGGFDFISFLTNCSSLEVLGLDENRFGGGELPKFIGNLSSTLQILTLGSNNIYGKVPNEIGKLVNLALLGLEGNWFSGTIPDSIGKLNVLEGLHLNYNKFSGKIPLSFSNLTTITRLFMEENRLEGNIPPSLGNCKNLLVLNLSSNYLNGSIPKEVIGLSSLSISFSAANNSLTGSIPFEVGNLKNLKELHLSDNNLSGEIPSSLGSCMSLEHLLMNDNSLHGQIPKSLDNLRGLIEIDLSYNNLSGEIPDFLGKLPELKKLGLSNNNLEGKVPSLGIFANASAISIVGNKKLCGGVVELNLHACSQDHTSKNSLALKIALPATLGVLLSFLLCLSVFCCIKKRPRDSSTEDHQLGISYAEIAKSTNGFSEENLLGSGSFGTVYKGYLNIEMKVRPQIGEGSSTSRGTKLFSRTDPREKEVVAVKVLNLDQQGASESFMDECSALTSVKHRNLIKIVTACSSIDHQGCPFKALVFEFMPNGNLDEWLHPRDQVTDRTRATLDLNQRLDIAMDVASALEYLHHHCETPIVHCDLKPSNILLDDDMTAHVGDFGLARFIFDDRENRTFSMQLKGSIGYIAPENGTGGQVSTLGDVYSFGILLLEMFTGKRPTDEIFTNGLSIQSFVSNALPKNAMQILDPSLFLHGKKEFASEEIESELREQSDNEYEDYGSILRDDMAEFSISVLRIGLACSSSLPRERMPMNIVVNKIQSIRNSLLRSQKDNSKKTYTIYILQFFDSSVTYLHQ